MNLYLQDDEENYDEEEHEQSYVDAEYEDEE